MYDLGEANKIYKEMMEKDSSFADKLVKEWRDKMPHQFAKEMFEKHYGKHLHSQEEYDKLLSYIVDNKGDRFSPWSMEDILKIAKEYIDIEEEPYTPIDLCAWSNIKKGDYGSIISDGSKIIRISIADLSDKDFYADPSERAYVWLEKHIERDKKEHKSEDY